VMPYFVGVLLELPVTTTQDHSLFHILNDFTMNLWRQQSDLILQQNGLISFIVHPDYMNGMRARDAYRALLAMLMDLHSNQNVWVALPRDVNRWWRQRDQMTLSCAGGNWSIQGPGSERARVAFATVDNDQLVYRLESQAIACAFHKNDQS
jgi:hypothetical protein